LLGVNVSEPIKLLLPIAPALALVAGPAIAR